MLTANRCTLDLHNAASGASLTMATNRRIEPKVRKRTYETLRSADTIGAFQIENRARMSMLLRRQPRKFYDLVIEIGLVCRAPIVVQNFLG